MSDGDPLVAVVILSWNGREDVLTCLESLQRSTWQPLVAIVVDNGSTDGTHEAVGDGFPDAVVVRSERNVGFAEGNNLGLRRALELGADYAFVLNNDTIVEPDAIGLLVAEARRRPDAGAVCPLVLYAEPPDVIWYAGSDYSAGRIYQGRQWGYGARYTGQYSGVAVCNRATGAAMLVPRPVLEQVGLFDGELFLHIEDSEWSLRAEHAGYRVYVVYAARVIHRVSMATGRENSPTIAYYAIRNTLIVGDRHNPRRGPVGELRRLATLGVHLVHARRADSPLTNVRAVLEGWRDYRRGRVGQRGSTTSPSGGVSTGAAQASGAGSRSAAT